MCIIVWLNRLNKYSKYYIDVCVYVRVCVCEWRANGKQTHEHKCSEPYKATDIVTGGALALINNKYQII